MGRHLHKASWTAAVVDAALQPLDTLRVPVSADFRGQVCSLIGASFVQ